MNAFVRSSARIHQTWQEFHTGPRVPLGSQSPHPTTFKVTRPAWSTRARSTVFSVLVLMTWSLVWNTGDVGTHFSVFHVGYHASFGSL